MSCPFGKEKELDWASHVKAAVHLKGFGLDVKRSVQHNHPVRTDNSKYSQGDIIELQIRGHFPVA